MFFKWIIREIIRLTKRLHSVQHLRVATGSSFVRILVVDVAVLLSPGAGDTW